MKVTEEQKKKNKLVNEIWKQAETRDRTRVQDYLTKKHIPIDYLDGDGATALAIVCTRGALDAVKILAELGASVNQVPSGRYVPLNNAGLYGHNEILRYLISSGANVNATFGDIDSSLLHNLCEHAPLVETIRILLQAGANANVLDKNGHTPLMLTAWFVRPREEDDVEIMNLLIQHGANPNIRDKESRTALKIAIVRGHSLQAQFLQKIGGTE